LTSRASRINTQKRPIAREFDLRIETTYGIANPSGLGVPVSEAQIVEIGKRWGQRRWKKGGTFRLLTDREGSRKRTIRVFEVVRNRATVVVVVVVEDYIYIMQQKSTSKLGFGGWRRFLVSFVFRPALCGLGI
jgi:hypothetical protein